jgi:hypothetical protein
LALVKPKHNQRIVTWLAKTLIAAMSSTPKGWKRPWLIVRRLSRKRVATMVGWPTSPWEVTPARAAPAE